MIFVILSSGENAVWLDMKTNGTALHYSKDATTDLNSIAHGIKEVLVINHKGPKYQRPDIFLQKILPKRIQLRPPNAVCLSDTIVKNIEEISTELSSDQPNMMVIGLIAEYGSSIVLSPEPLILIRKTDSTKDFIRVVANSLNG
jgi:fructose-1,6-bisphosphatase/sedoheptulose 1,7-bisphosphatase-like protein